MTTRRRRSSPTIPPGYCAYLTRKLPVELRDRMHALVRAKRRVGMYYTVEDIVNAALEIGVTLMEDGTRHRERESK